MSIAGKGCPWTQTRQNGDGQEQIQLLDPEDDWKGGSEKNPKLRIHQERSDRGKNELEIDHPLGGGWHVVTELW